MQRVIFNNKKGTAHPYVPVAAIDVPIGKTFAVLSDEWKREKAINSYRFKSLCIKRGDMIECQAIFVTYRRVEGGYMNTEGGTRAWSISHFENQECIVLD